MTDTVPVTPLPHRQVMIIVGALMLVLLLASLDQTIVSTALPTIVGEFGELEHLSWIVTSYMLATTVVTPLYGKLGDLFGRKLILQGAIVIFLAGSVLCGFSQSMTQLIVFRALQGLGGGGLIVSAMAAVGDIISPRERGLYQGYFGAVFGVSTVIGPLIGGFFVEQLTWRWIFYINLPLGLLALIVIGVVFSSPAEKKSPRIDVVGAALLAVMLTSLVLLASTGGQVFPWSSATSMVLGALALASLAAFIVVENRVAEPILPPALFANRTFVVCAAVGFIVGLAMFGSITFMPVYLQAVEGISPAQAGIHLTPMMGGMLITSIASGQVISRIGRYRMFPIIGTAVMAVGLVLLSTISVGLNAWITSGYMLVLGLGLGMVMQVLILAVQNAVDYRYLGVATSGTTMFRMIGGSVGVAVFGAILSIGLTAGLTARLPPGTSVPHAPDAAAIARLPDDVRSVYLSAFVDALQPVFLIAAVVTVLGFVLAWLMEEVQLRGPARSEDIGDAFGMPRDATSLEELGRIVARISDGRHRWDLFERVARRLGVDLQPDEIWLLAVLGREENSVTESALLERFSLSRPELDTLARQLRDRGLVDLEAGGVLRVTDQGRVTHTAMVRAYRARLTELVSRWHPEQHDDVRTMLTSFSRQLLEDLPRRSGHAA